MDNMATLPSNRPETIAAEIKKAFHTIVAHDMTRRDAQNAAQDASQAATNAREAALVRLAAGAVSPGDGRMRTSGPVASGQGAGVLQMDSNP
jgi:hypothetical protein